MLVITLKEVQFAFEKRYQLFISSDNAPQVEWPISARRLTREAAELEAQNLVKILQSEDVEVRLAIQEN